MLVSQWSHVIHILELFMVENQLYLFLHYVRLQIVNLHQLLHLPVQPLEPFSYPLNRLLGFLLRVYLAVPLENSLSFVVVKVDGLPGV